MKKTFLFITLVFSNWLTINAQQAQPAAQPKSEIKTQNTSKKTAVKLTYKIINAPEKTYCYDIYADNKLTIHQPSIPGMPGNKGFKTNADAEKVAKLVIEKMKKGEMPPTVTTDEMKKLKVIN